jgi:predicted deacylase
MIRSGPPPDLARFARGNSGIPFVWTFAGADPGPHAMINCVTHGNEPCGAVAVARLLDEGIRPARGTLTLSFANTAAYESFRAGRDLPARYLDRDLNRLWRDDWIDADTTSREAARAKALRPVLRTVGALLDLHSTASASRPFFVIAEITKTRRLADAMGWPPTQQLMPGGCLEGRHMIDYGRFSDPTERAVAVTVECGRHLDPTSADIAYAVALRFLAANGLIDAADPRDKNEPIRRFRVVEPYIVRSDRFALSIPDGGFVQVSAGQRVATDGGYDVLAPYEATIIAPRPDPRMGLPAFMWAVELA